jgi:hypothetical protein
MEEAEFEELDKVKSWDLVVKELRHAPEPTITGR